VNLAKAREQPGDRRISDEGERNGEKADPTFRDLDVYQNALVAGLRVYRFIGQLVKMIDHPEKWRINSSRPRP
jgi:hypothetical protein